MTTDCTRGGRKPLPSLRQPSLQPRRAWPPQTAASRRRPFGKAACLLLLRLRRRLLSTAHSTHCRRSSRTSSRLRQPLLQAHSARNAALDHAAGQWTNSCLDAASSLPLQLGCASGCIRRVDYRSHSLSIEFSLCGVCSSHFFTFTSAGREAVRL